MPRPQPHPASRRPAAFVPEPLEPRALFAVGPFPNVDLAPVAGNQSEPAIAVDPSNPLRLFAAANNDDEDEQNPGATGLTAAYSTDGGLTWIGLPAR